MLKKLFQYEFKNTAKLMLTIYGILTLITTLNTVILFSQSRQKYTNNAADSVTFLFLLLYILSAIALFIITFLYMCFHFYKTMYSSQGYLTHTLPVKPLTTFHVKLITSSLWMLLSILMVVFSILMLLTGATRGEFFTVLLSYMKSSYPGSLKLIILYIILSIILSCVSHLLLVFASMSIGQLFHQQKLVASFAAGIVLYLISQMINYITFIVYMVNATHSSPFLEADSSILGPSFILMSLITSFLLSVIYYSICAVIVKKHINLD